MRSRNREVGARRTRRVSLKMRCSIARTARASNAPRIRPLFPDWDRACSAHLEGNRRGALGPNSPDFTGAARQHLPKDAGPRGFMPREQCKRRSLRPAMLKAFAITGLSQRSAFALRASADKSALAFETRRDRSDACRAGRCLHIPKRSELFETLPCGDEEKCTAGGEGGGYEILVRFGCASTPKRYQYLRARAIPPTERLADALVNGQS